MNKVIQNSFTGGEQSPAMFGRIDDQGGYQAGLAKCENFIVLPQGPVQNRAGFEFVRAAKYADKPCVLIPFTFNTSQTMVIELGEKYASPTRLKHPTLRRTWPISTTFNRRTSLPLSTRPTPRVSFSVSGLRTGA